MDASTELFDAIRAGDVTRVRALVTADRGIVNRRNDHGHSPVLIAQYHHQPEVVAVLLAAGPDLDISTHLRGAWQRGAASGWGPARSRATANRGTGSTR